FFTTRSLGQFAPGEPFRIAAGARYDRQKRRGSDRKPNLTQQPRPQGIRNRQPGWLLLVNTSPEDHEHAIRGPGIAANKITVPGNRVRVRDQHAARTGTRPNHDLAFA